MSCSTYRLRQLLQTRRRPKQNLRPLHEGYRRPQRIRLLRVVEGGEEELVGGRRCVCTVDC